MHTTNKIAGLSPTASSPGWFASSQRYTEMPGNIATACSIGPDLFASSIFSTARLGRPLASELIRGYVFSGLASAPVTVRQSHSGVGSRTILIECVAPGPWTPMKMKLASVFVHMHVKEAINIPCTSDAAALAIRNDGKFSINHGHRPRTSDWSVAALDINLPHGRPRGP